MYADTGDNNFIFDLITTLRDLKSTIFCEKKGEEMSQTIFLLRFK